MVIDVSEETEQFRSVVTALMEIRGIGEVQLAEMMGMSERRISSRLSGRAPWYADEVFGLSVVFGVPVGILWRTPEEAVGVATGAIRPDALQRKAKVRQKIRPPIDQEVSDRDGRVYRAGAKVPAGDRIETVAAARNYVVAVVHDDRWQQTYPHAAEVRVRGSGTSRTKQVPGWHEPRIAVEGLRHTIYLPPWARRPLIILHELAHAAQPHRSLSHGREFVRVWLDLVERHMGRDAAAQLRAALKSEGVTWASRPSVVRRQQRSDHYVGDLVAILNGDKPVLVPETWGERFDRAYRRAKRADHEAGEPPLTHIRLATLAHSMVPEARPHHLTMLRRERTRPDSPAHRRMAYAFLVVMGYETEVIEDDAFGLNESDRPILSSTA